MELKEAKESIGKQVYYENFNKEREYGFIKSVNDRFVFVVYERPGRDMQFWKQYPGIATNPSDLTLIKKKNRNTNETKIN